MKNNKLFILFLFVFNIVFSQEQASALLPANASTTKDNSSYSKVNQPKWSIEIGTGMSNGSVPYTEGYYTATNNQIFNSFNLDCYTAGATYNFSEIVAIKMDLAFDRFVNDAENTSKRFEVAQYRTSVQAVFNLNSFINPLHHVSRFNVLFHAGLNLAIIDPIAADYNKVVSNNDNLGGIVFGITPKLRISTKTSIILDFSAFNNYGQNLTWNGKHSALSNSSEGRMYSGTVGLSFALDNTKK